MKERIKQIDSKLLLVHSVLTELLSNNHNTQSEPIYREIELAEELLNNIRNELADISE